MNYKNGEKYILNQDATYIEIQNPEFFEEEIYRKVEKTAEKGEILTYIALFEQGKYLVFRSESQTLCYFEPEDIKGVMHKC